MNTPSIEMIREFKIVMGSFDFGLTCDLYFSHIINNMFIFEPREDECSGYISWSGIEIVFMYNDVVYMRKFLDDDLLFINKNVAYTNPVIFKNQDIPTEFSGFLESTFDGFDAIDVKLMFTLDWFKSLFENSNIHLLVKT